MEVLMLEIELDLTDLDAEYHGRCAPAATATDRKHAAHSCTGKLRHLTKCEIDFDLLHKGFRLCLRPGGPGPPGRPPAARPTADDEPDCAQPSTTVGSGTTSRTRYWKACHATLATS